MPTDLDPVYEELKRLQLEGMDRVFIEDSTMALLTPIATPLAPTATPVVAIDLQSAVNSGQQPNAAAPKLTPRTKAAATSSPLPDAPTIELPSADAATQMQWLKELVENSPVCKERLRKDEKVVFGEGAPFRFRSFGHRPACIWIDYSLSSIWVNLIFRFRI